VTCGHQSHVLSSNPDSPLYCSVFEREGCRRERRGQRPGERDEARGESGESTSPETPHLRDTTTPADHSTASERGLQAREHRFPDAPLTPLFTQNDKCVRVWLPLARQDCIRVCVSVSVGCRMWTEQHCSCAMSIRHTTKQLCLMSTKQLCGHTNKQLCGHNPDTSCLHNTKQLCAHNGKQLSASAYLELVSLSKGVCLISERPKRPTY
jgi:hypothetical protein